MSSLIGHAATGAAIYLSQRTLQPFKYGAGFGTCLLLAVAPDLDYLAQWIGQIKIEPRVTHSILCCFGMAMLAYVCLQATTIRQDQSISITTLVLASCSHLVLDLLVAVHGLPLLWPFTSIEFTSPIGVLPSAGRLSFTNFYLWRNLIIELGVLLPVMALLIAVRRHETARFASLKYAPILPVWFAFVWWASSLQR